MKASGTTPIARHLSPEEISGQCQRLLGSRCFAHGHQLRKLLAFMVRHTLLNDQPRITQALIAQEVLGADDFDSVYDSSVRRLAARLRERLRDYYGSEGRDDAVIFLFPKGQPYRLLAVRRHSLETAHPLDDRAFEEYRKGRSLWALRTPESLLAAMECFRRAIQLFPSYSLAFSALGECFFFMAIGGAASAAVMPEAKAHVVRAIEIDEGNAEAHAILGAIYSAYDWDWTAATREFERALTLDDKTPGIYCWYASHLVSLGDYRRAIHIIRLAQATDLPVASVLVNAHAAKILLAAGCPEDAASLLALLREQDPNFYLLHLHAGILEGIVGEAYGLAIKSLQKAAALSNQNSSALAALGLVYARSGRIADAESTLAILLERARATYVPATDLAPLLLAVGRPDESFQYLERAFEEKCIFLSWLSCWPPLQELARDPHGKEMMRCLGLQS